MEIIAKMRTHKLLTSWIYCLMFLFQTEMLSSILYDVNVLLSEFRAKKIPGKTKRFRYRKES